VHPGRGDSVADLAEGSWVVGGSPADLFNIVPMAGGPAGDADLCLTPSLVSSCVLGR
jgi:hypothetical protein